MYKNKSIALVLPVHNEEKLIGQTIEKIPDYIDKICQENNITESKLIDYIEEK